MPIRTSKPKLKKEPLGQIRVYKKEQGIISRLVHRERARGREVTAADVIRKLIKG